MAGSTSRGSLLLVLLVLSARVASATEDAEASNPELIYGRSLQQASVSCPTFIPACTPRRCTTRILDSKEAYVCLRCMRGYVPVKGKDGKSVVQCGECQGTPICQAA